MMPRRTLAVALASLLAQGASGLYADEVGRLDWHQQNLGRFVSAAFDGRGGVTVVGEVSLGVCGSWWGWGTGAPLSHGISKSSKAAATSIAARSSASRSQRGGEGVSGFLYGLRKVCSYCVQLCIPLCMSSNAVWSATAIFFFSNTE